MALRKGSSVYGGLAGPGKTALNLSLARVPVSVRLGSLTVVIAGLHVMSAALMLLSSASGALAGWDNLPVDESWLRMTYIRNFADSFVLEFNAGEPATGATGPLWILLNGAIASALDLEPGLLPVLSKVPGVSFGVLSALIVVRITLQITRSTLLAGFAGAVLAVEPHFSFAAVSGTEVTLFAALSLCASWAFMRGRLRTAGLVTAIAITARPEGILLAALIFGVTVGRWMWRRNGAVIQQARDLEQLTWLAGPSATVMLAWVSFNWAVTGAALPDSYLATRQEIGLLPFSNLWNVWLGYLHQLPFMYGTTWIIGLPLILLGIHALIRRNSFSAVPLALFAAAMVYSTMLMYTRPGEPWTFSDRRHLDPALPFIVILLMVGTARSWQLVRAWKQARRPQSHREQQAIVLTAWAASVLMLVVPLVAMSVKWGELTSEFSWSSRNTTEIHVAMGKWLNDATPENAVIGASPVGAISFFAEREVIDLSGKNNHDALGRSPIEYGIEQEVEYLVAFRSPFFDSIPGRAVVHEQFPIPESPFYVDALRAYGPESSAVQRSAPRDALAIFNPAGLEVIDGIDVGNGFAADSLSESSHDYGIEGGRSASTVKARVGENEVLEDDYRSFTVAEEFMVASVPGTPLTIARRYDATVAVTLRVYVDGVETGLWHLPREAEFFGEAAFTVPGSMIQHNRSTLRFELIPSQTAIAANSFFYWILVPEGTIPQAS